MILRSSYTEEDMLLAYDRVKTEVGSVVRAAQESSVPRITLLDKISGLHKTRYVGRPTALMKMEESVLVDLLVLMGEYNYPLTKRDLQDMVKGYLDRTYRSNTGYGMFLMKSC
jgi:hypothetical protein